MASCTLDFQAGNFTCILRMKSFEDISCKRLLLGYGRNWRGLIEQKDPCWRTDCKYYQCRFYFQGQRSIFKYFSHFNRWKITYLTVDWLRKNFLTQSESTFTIAFLKCLKNLQKFGTKQCQVKRNCTRGILLSQDSKCYSEYFFHTWRLVFPYSLFVFSWNFALKLK